MERHRVLVVEDNRDSREILAMLLRLWGFDVRSAGDGRSGLQTALAWGPEVAVLDIGLPGVDGYEVARQLRARFGSRIRIVALTAYRDMPAECRALFDEHMVKPTDPEQLHSRLLVHCLTEKN